MSRREIARKNVGIKKIITSLLTVKHGLKTRYMQYVERIAAEFRISQDIEYEILIKTPFRICVEFGANLMQNSTFFNEDLPNAVAPTV